MENSIINIVHVRVNRDREKIWTMCKIAALQKDFEFARIFGSSDEAEFEENMKELKLADAYILILNKREKEIYWERIMKPRDRMANDEFEVSYDKAMEWLIEL